MCLPTPHAPGFLAIAHYEPESLDFPFKRILKKKNENS
jgi:hypothetical protein